MSTNTALADLENTADVDEAKRDLVLRFIRDQESLQTSQVDLKLIDDNTIDLIDSNGNDLNHNVTIKDVRTVGCTPEDSKLVAPRPPSGRPGSRRLHRKSSYETPNNPRKISLSSVHSTGTVFGNSSGAVDRLAAPGHSVVDRLAAPGNSIVDRLVMSSSNTIGMDRLTMSPCGMDRFTRPMSPPPPLELNSSWPQQEFVSRKLSSRKYVLYSPENNYSDSRPVSTKSHKQIAESRSTSPAKRHSSKSRGRTYMNLNIEPVHPSEIPLLRGTSASGSVGAPYTLVHLPPIQTTPPSI